MARDCPDRQRGTDWRNNGFGRGPRAIGGGDAVDREMEVSFFFGHINFQSKKLTLSQQLMHELSGGAPGEEAPRRIEAGPDQGYDDRDMKPWQQRGPPPSDVAPWQQRGRDNRRDDYGPRDQGGLPPWAAQNRGGDYGYGAPGGGYGAPGIPPWQQQAPPPPPGGQPAYGYGGYSSYPPGMGAPGAPGFGVPPPPPGMPSTYYGSGTPPPPPPPADGPPPPVSLPYEFTFRI